MAVSWQQRWRGALGVQVGTCLLVSQDAHSTKTTRPALLNAKDSDTIVTGRIGVPRSVC